MSNTIPFLITARLSSVRLPKKLLRELDGTEVISKVIERGINAFGEKNVILCTSYLDTDDELVTISERHGIGIHRGDPVDILLRLAGPVRERNAVGFVGQTGENPLFQIDHCLRIRDAIEQGRDLVRYKGLPIGCSPYGIGRAALETVLATKEEQDTGFWGYWLNRPNFFDTLWIDAENELQLPTKRLTIDYPEDLELMRAIFALHPGMPDLRDVLTTIKANDTLNAINAMHEQGDMPEDMKAAINDFFLRRGDEVRRVLGEQRTLLS
jgi:spore coat polysaccharide biosynthesis protein SpsF (cytidylyltransferase family)